MSSQQPPLEEPSILSPLLPSSFLPTETDVNSYYIPVPPLIVSTFTPYFDLATGTTHQVAPALPSVQLHTEASDLVRRTGATIFSTKKSNSVPVAQICVCQLTVCGVFRRLGLRVYSTSVNWMKIAGRL